MRTAIVVIGCPDYLSLMADRAQISKLASLVNGDGSSQFVGSEAFPSSLAEAVRKYDPAGLFLSLTDHDIAERDPLKNEPLPDPSEEQKEALRPLLAHCIGGKRILNLAGGRDKLVPYYRGQAFLEWLKKAVAPTGWFADGGVVFEDAIDPEAGHQMTPKMTNEAIRFIVETLVDVDGGQRKRGFVRDVKL